LADIRKYLTIAPNVEQSLDQLSEQLFEQLVGGLEQKLTLALREVLEQPISLRADRGFSRGSVTIDFYIEREGHHEDIMRGQGGSVANILSVGLRMFALATLDPAKHRRFLVLDEQDCWLQPDIVPKLVKIIHDASRALGFQVILISHHDTAHFAAFADRIYRFALSAGGICEVSLEQHRPHTQDSDAGFDPLRGTAD
jgi:ABC-type thiamine transport system ATPase subunit